MSKAKQPFPWTAAVVLAVAIVAAAVFSWNKWGRAGTQATPAPVAGPETTNPASSVAPLKPGYEKVKGRWMRSDGDYLLEIRAVEPGGKMEVGYLNPRPIHVAKAEASQVGETLKVFIELRDVNYPGSTYNLAYDPAADRLKGTYYQAVTGETYEILFVRLKP